MERPKLNLPRMLWAPRDDCLYAYDYGSVVGEINQNLSNEKALLRVLRYWCREDLFFLLFFILKLDIHHPWLVERIKEVQHENVQTLDLWPREHFKSTILTYGLNIFEIIKNPEIRIGLFSHTRTIAKSFLRRIKQTFEDNVLLKTVFPDILWQEPQKAAPKWSEDEGITVIRKGIYQEQTLEAWGLTDGMPTSKHFDILHYDDVVTRESVNTPEQIAKTEECFNLSGKLGASDLLRGKEGKRRVIGTIYHFNDLYTNLEKRKTWKVRKYPVQRADGSYIFFTPKQAARKRKEDGPYVWATQMMLDPRAEGRQKFKFEWIHYYHRLPQPIVKVLTVDPAHSRKEKQSQSDYTAMWVWGIDVLGHRFWVDGIRKRLNLTGKWEELKRLLLKHPGISKIGYERYGMQADIEYFEGKMQDESFYFVINELKGPMSKEDRIGRLIPWFENGKVFLPRHIMQENDEGEIENLVDTFVNEEFLFWPFASHDDLLDAASRIEDFDVKIWRPISVGAEESGDVIKIGEWAERKQHSRFARV